MHGKPVPWLVERLWQNGVTRPVILILVFLLTPVVVPGEETLYIYDFEDPELVDWEIPYSETQRDYASFSAHNGYGFCNLSGVDTSWLWGGGGKAYSIQQYLFAGLEMRVRFSSDNKLESDYGGGIRRWGFRTEPESIDYSLTFRSMERGCMPAIDDNHPGGHPGDELLGFMATSNLDEPWAFIEQIEGIDLTEWHTYTILWEPEAATFLIDNLVVAEIDEAPHMPMGIYLSWWTGLNLTPPCRKVGQEEACTDEYVQIDYIRVFTHTEWQEELSQKMLALFSQVDARMSEAEDGGKDVSRLRDDYTSLEEIWEKESYSSYGRIKEALEGILTVLEAWDEVVEMFYQANATIQEAEQLGADARTITIMKGYYSQAEIKWKEQDIESTEIYLQKILDMPEPLSLYLISLLGLISLPVFRQRWFRDVVRLDTEEGLGKPLPGLHFCILRCFYKEALSDQPRVSGGAQRGSEKEE